MEKEPVVLHFHHVDPATKISTISDLINRLTHMDRILDEIDKCVCICGNCHSKVHNNLLPKPTEPTKIDRSLFKHLIYDIRIRPKQKIKLTKFYASRHLSRTRQRPQILPGVAQPDPMTVRLEES